MPSQRRLRTTKLPLLFTQRITTLPGFIKTLRVTPAMEAGISEHVLTIEEIVNLLD